ncbi:MAG: hypothetical protein HY329_00695 [Chloroflexi bacterium]|nr:hypothetical protein [Chloroflexota bacterium]
MHARAVTYHYLPAKTDDLLAIYRDSVVPDAQQQSGFKGAILLMNDDLGKAISITLWETADDLRTSEESGYREQQRAKLEGARFEEPSEYFVVKVKV